MQIIVYLIFWFKNDKKQQTKSHLVQVWILLCFLFPCLLLHSNVSNLFMAEIISMISTKRCIFLAIKCSISYILWPKKCIFFPLNYSMASFFIVSFLLSFFWKCSSYWADYLTTFNQKKLFWNGNFPLYVTFRRLNRLKCQNLDTAYWVASFILF